MWVNFADRSTEAARFYKESSPKPSASCVDYHGSNGWKSPLHLAQTDFPGFRNRNRTVSSVALPGKVMLRSWYDKISRLLLADGSQHGLSTTIQEGKEGLLTILRLGRQFRWLGPKCWIVKPSNPMNLCRFDQISSFQLKRTGLPWFWPLLQSKRFYVHLCAMHTECQLLENVYYRVDVESGCSCRCVVLSPRCQSASSTSSHPRIVDTAESWKSRLAVPCCCSLPQIHIVIVWSVHSINN